MGIATGGVLSGLLSGWRMGDQDTRQRKADARVEGEYAYTQQRRAIEDPRKDLSFMQGQEDRTRNIAREAKRDNQADTQFNWLVDAKAHEKERQPIVEAMADEQAGLNIRRTKQVMRQSDLSFGAQQGEAAIRAEMARMNLDDAKIQQLAARNQRAVLGALVAAEQTGDMSSVARTINATIGKDHGFEIKSIQPQPGGGFAVDFGGDKPVTFGSIDQFAETAIRLTDPDTHLKILQSQISQRLGLNQGGTAQERMVSFIASNLPAVDGETPQQRNMRAVKAYTQMKRGMSPETFFANILKSVLPQDPTEAQLKKAKETATSLTQDFVASQDGEDAMGLSAAMPTQQEAPPPAEQQSGGWLSGLFGGNAPAAAAPAAGPQGRSTGPGETPPAPGAKKAPDGKWYVPDPARPGKYLLVQ